MRLILVPLVLLSLLAGCDRGADKAPQEHADKNPASAPKAAEGSIEEALSREHSGKPAPDYTFADTAGGDSTMADFAGKPVLVNLWATWCAPCKNEMPKLDALAKRFEGKVEVLPISQDLEGPDIAMPWWNSAGLSTIEPYFDTENNWSFFVGNNVVLPTTIYYDSDGKEIWRITGDIDWDSPQADELVAEGY